MYEETKKEEQNRKRIEGNPDTKTKRTKAIFLPVASKRKHREIVVVVGYDTVVSSVAIVAYCSSSDY